MTNTREVALEAALKKAVALYEAYDLECASPVCGQLAGEARAAIAKPHDAATPSADYATVCSDCGINLKLNEPKTTFRGLQCPSCNHVIAARPDQPAADTRVTAQLKAISLALAKITGRDGSDEAALDHLAAEIRSVRAIIEGGPRK